MVARPTNYIVKGAQALDRVTGKLIVPGVATSIVGSMLAGAWFHGVASLYFIFGREDFDILMSGEGPESLGKFGVASLAGFPFLLILSRTTLADPLLTAIPILTIAFHIPSSDALKTSAPLWPPSAAMAFSMFPFVRGAYNQTYYWLFAERLKKWTKKVQPRAGEDNPEGNNGGEENNAGPEVVEIELGLDIQMVEVDDDGNEIEPGQEDHQPQPAQGQEAADANPQNDQAAIAAGAANDNGNNAPAQQPQEPAAAAPANRGNQLLISTSRVVDTIVGALAFPLLASVMGRLIKLGLPRSWSHGGYNRRPGLLATTWGRSLVGGCLLVVMKDTLQVYTRYRIAQDHMKRRVINYDRTKRGSGKK